MPLYSKEQIAQKGYTVYLDGIKQPKDTVLEADTDAGWILVEKTSYSAWGAVKKISVSREYGKVHMVLEEIDDCEEYCRCDRACECEPGNCCDRCIDPDIVLSDGYYI